MRSHMRLHILPIPTYRIFFCIASESHMQKLCCICKNLHIFAYMPHISAYAIAFFSIFLVQRCFKTTKYFGGKRLPVFAIRRWINWSQKCQNCRNGLLMIMIMILHHSNLHMPEICGKICCIYAAHISPNSTYFSTYFASKKFRIF